VSRVLLRVTMVLAGFGIVGASPAAQTGSTPEELTVRPGDTLNWTILSPHRLRFGGSVTVNGKPLALTSFADVQKVLDLSPAPTVDAQGVAMWAVGAEVTGTVKKDAPASGVKEFFFTCGFDPHAPMMVSVSFTVAAAGTAPARMVDISSATPPKWIMKTPLGNKDLKRP
jgi:hypothetical protein